MTCTLELLCRPGRRRRGWTLPSGLWHARWVHVIGEVQDSGHGADHWTVKHHHSMRLCPIHLAFVRFVLAAFPSVPPVAHEIKMLWERAQNALIICTFNRVHCNDILNLITLVLKLCCRCWIICFKPNVFFGTWIINQLVTWLIPFKEHTSLTLNWHVCQSTQ